MNFEKLANYPEDKSKDKKIAAGFSSRQNARDKAYSAVAKSQATTDKFYSRSYNL